MNPYPILEKKRAGEALSEAEIRSVVEGAASGAWSDGQLGAFLMAAAIHELDSDETRALTQAMLESGEQWALRDRFPLVVDKHSTGGVGDKVSLILGPVLAACGLPVVMLTGRALGHTGGTADKLESIPGLDLGFDRARCEHLLSEVGLAIGIATREIAPADRRLYGLRDQTATVSSLPLVVGSILSKKLAVGPAAIVFDVKTGNGAIFPDAERGLELSRRMVEICASLGCKSRALVTDMSQPLGRWVGHAAEVRETYECFRGEGEERLVELTFELCLAVAEEVGHPLDRDQLQQAMVGGEAQRRFERWAEIQGAEASWLAEPSFRLGADERPILASRDGVLSAVDTRRLGMAIQTAAGAGSSLDQSVSLRYSSRLGAEVEQGDELARLYLADSSSDSNDAVFAEVAACLVIADSGEAPELIAHRV